MVSGSGSAGRVGERGKATVGAGSPPGFILRCLSGENTSALREARRVGEPQRAEHHRTGATPAGNHLAGQAGQEAPQGELGRAEDPPGQAPGRTEPTAKSAEERSGEKAGPGLSETAPGGHRPDKRGRQDFGNGTLTLGRVAAAGAARVARDADRAHARADRFGRGSGGPDRGCRARGQASTKSLAGKG